MAHPSGSGSPVTRRAARNSTSNGRTVPKPRNTKERRGRDPKGKRKGTSRGLLDRYFPRHKRRRWLRIGTTGLVIFALLVLSKSWKWTSPDSGSVPSTNAFRQARAKGISFINEFRRGQPAEHREALELEKKKKKANEIAAIALKQRALHVRRRKRIQSMEVDLSSIGIVDGVKALEEGVRRRDLSSTEWFPKRRHGLDFGGLEISLLEEGERRRIIEDSKEGARVKIYYTDDASDSFDQYDSMDDDGFRSRLFTHMNKNTECRTPSWFGIHFPTCNSFHEMRIVHADAGNRYLGRGFFRTAFLLREKNQPEAVLKVIRWKERGTVFIHDRYEKTRMDALVMERLTSSPRITDMYGHCATSIITESLPVEVWGEAVPVDSKIRARDLHDRDDVDPKNTYSPTEKINMALELAEALADLHGFKDGIIVHDDLDLGQYLRKTKDGQIKLNDFNRAKPMLWDDSKQEYCKYYNGGIGGKVRAPEEFVPTILDEKIDIFSLGNCFYGLLTGLYPFYFKHSDDAQKKLLDGELPFVDERYRLRSYAEGKLVEAIELCHHSKPRHRSDVFAIVKHLRAAVEENERQERSRESRPY